MAVEFSFIDWEDSQTEFPIAVYAVDFSVSLTYDWHATEGALDDTITRARFMTVDNSESNQTLHVTFDNLPFVIIPFERKTLQIPPGSHRVILTGDATSLLTCTVIFAVPDLSFGDTVNYKLIQTSGTEGVLWPVVFKTGPANPVASDDHTIWIWFIAGATASQPPDPTTVSNGWTWQAWNDGTSTANVTVTPLGGATIDGAASLILTPGSKKWLVADGANYRTVTPTTGNPAVQYFTANGNWTQSDAARTLDYIEVEVQAPGGGGAGAGVTAAATASCGSPGGAGGYARKKILAASLNLAGEVVTIGGAAAGGAAGANPGTTGTTTSFGAHVSATGGVGGVSNAAHGDNRSFNGALGGFGVGGDLNTRGGPGQASIQSSAIGAPVAMNGCGGDAFLGGGARNVALVGGGAQTGNGLAADGFGGGGSGGLSYGGGAAASGGASAPGVIIVHEFYK